MYGRGGPSYPSRGRGAGWNGRGGRGGGGGPGRGGVGGGGGGGFGGQKYPQQQPYNPSQYQRPAPPAQSPASMPRSGQAGYQQPLPPRRIESTELTSNCWDVNITDSTIKLFRYEVDIVANDPPAATEAGSASLASPSKHIRRALWRQLELKLDDGSIPAYFAGVRPVFDGGEAAYSATALPLTSFGTISIPNISTPDRPRRTYTISLRNPREISLSSIRSYTQGLEGFHVGEVAQVPQAVNCIIAHTASDKLFSVGGSYYVTESTSLGGPFVEKSLKLSACVKLLRGFFGAVRCCPGGMQLNLNTTSTAVFVSGYLPRLLVSFICEKGRARNERGAFEALNVDNADERLVEVIEHFNPLIVRKVEVTIHRGGSTRRLKTKVRGRGVLLRQPRDCHFDITDAGATNVEQYLGHNFGIRLDNPDFPVIEVRPGVLYPIEIVSIDNRQRYLARLTPAEQRNAHSFWKLAPSTNFAGLEKVRNDMVPPLLERQLDDFRLSIAPAPKRVPARILPPPHVEYGHLFATQTVIPDRGEWKIRITRNPATGQYSVSEKLAYGGSVQSVVVVLVNKHDKRKVEEWLDELFNLASALGMTIGSDPSRPRVRYSFFTLPSVVNVGQVVAKSLETKPDLIIWFFEESRSSLYAPFKFAAISCGIASQGLQAKHIGASSVQLLFNIILKINPKVGGYNHRLAAPTTGNFLAGGKTRKEEDEERQLRQLSQPQDPSASQPQASTTSAPSPPMIFGADVAHEPNRPSIAVLTGSMHGANIVYEETVRVQGLTETGEGARPKRKELIEDLEKMVLDLLKRRIFCTGKLPPASVLFFRDGVSEGEFPAVVDNEVSAFHRAFAALKADAKVIEEFREELKANAEVVEKFREELVEWKPKLIVVLTVKRHHYRFFAEGAGGQSNPKPGTFVDSDVTDPRLREFYGVAHNALIGTARPTRFVVVADERGLSLEEAEEAANVQAYAFQRCNKAVSLPAATYYAHLIGYHVRNMLYSGDAATSASEDWSTAEARASDLEGATAKLGETKHGREAFRSKNSEQVKRPSAMWWL